LVRGHMGEERCSRGHVHRRPDSLGGSRNPWPGVPLGRRRFDITRVPIDNGRRRRRRRRSTLAFGLLDSTLQRCGCGGSGGDVAGDAADSLRGSRRALDRHECAVHEGQAAFLHAHAACIALSHHTTTEMMRNRTDGAVGCRTRHSNWEWVRRRAGHGSG
jgi:hypothetical protein